MPYVTAGFFTNLGVGKVVAGVLAFVANVAITVVISTGLNKLFGKSADNNLGGFENRMQMVRSPIAPRQIVYGEARVSGPLILAHVTGSKNEYLNMIVAVAGHEVNEIGDVYLDDEVVIEGSGTTPIAKYTGFIDCVKLLGTDAQTVDSTMDTNMGGTWGTNHRLRGIAAIYLRLLWDPDKFPGGVPNVSCVVQGKKLYDFRDTTTAYGTNPILALYDFMTNARYGLGIPAADLDIAASGTWEVAADVCDELQPLDAGGDETRYTVNGSTDTGARPTETINTLVAAMAGRLYYVSGEYRVYAGAYEAPSITLDEDDLVGPITVATDIPRREKFNSIKGVFANPVADWELTDFPSQECRL
jgi:hypothetical protein